MTAVLREVTEVLGNSLVRGWEWSPQRASDDSLCVGVSQVMCESKDGG